MGNQLRFFLTPVDLQLLETRLRDQCQLVVLDYRAERPAPKCLSSLAVAEPGKTWLTIILTEPEFMDALVFEHVANQGYWTVDLLRSPAMELSRCFYDGTILRIGRLYYNSGFHDETGNWVEKAASFLVWAKKALSVARQGLQWDAALSAYVGQNARAEREQKGLKLVSL